MEKGWFPFELSFFGIASLRVAWSDTTIPDTSQMLKHFLVIMQSEPDVLEEKKETMTINHSSHAKDIFFCFT